MTELTTRTLQAVAKARLLKDAANNTDTAVITEHQLFLLEKNQLKLKLKY